MVDYSGEMADMRQSCALCGAQRWFCTIVCSCHCSLYNIEGYLCRNFLELWRVVLCVKLGMSEEEAAAWQVMNYDSQDFTDILILVMEYVSIGLPGPFEGVRSVHILVDNISNFSR